MIESAAERRGLLQRLLQRWRDADPWLSMAAATVVLTVASRPDDFRDAVGAFLGAGLIILFTGVFGVPIVCDIVFSLTKRDVRDRADGDTEELIDFVRVSRLVFVLLVVLLWGSNLPSLGSGSNDPGDRDPHEGSAVVILAHAVHGP